MAQQKLLNKYEKNVHSQTGEDGIIKHIFSKIPQGDQWCVEFGAWDGIAFSNTRALVEQNWHAVLIEPNPRKFVTLEKNTENYPNVINLQSFVELSGSKRLDALLSAQKVPLDFELLSIDIDGNDYWIWETVKKYKPKVVVIEFNQTIPPDVEFVQPRDFSVNQGNSLLSLTKLANKKGYELICCTESNAFFVRKKYFSLFKLKSNKPEDLFEYQYQTRVFQLFDGTLKLVDGPRKLLWSSIPFSEEDIQVLPKWLRRFPEGWLSIGLLIITKHFKNFFSK